jgi:D-threo-aldose 1-dehydrogenase
MNQTAMLTRFVRECGLDCLLVAGRYTLLDQSAADELLPACAQHGVGVLAGGVYNSGILADPRPGATYDYAPADPSTLARARAIAESANAMACRCGPRRCSPRCDTRR